MTSGQRMKDRQKRGSFPFKTLFRLSRYDFRLPRYRRVKTRVIFNRLISPSSSLTRTSRSRLASLTYPKHQLRFLEKKQVSVSRVYLQTSRRLKYYENFECLYLGNSLRYRDKTKSGLNGMISSTSRARFNGNMTHFFLHTSFHQISRFRFKIINPLPAPLQQPFLRLSFCPCTSMLSLPPSVR